jgi:hypothetical protein
MNSAAIIAELLVRYLPSVISIIEQAVVQARERQATRPIPFGRKHDFTILTTPPSCVYCKTPLTADNRDQQCPGPPMGKE